MKHVWTGGAVTCVVAGSVLIGAMTGAPPAGSSKTEAAPAEIFSERARETGLDFVHFNGMSGEYYFAENMGSGVALFDYDNDGDLDIFLVQGSMLGSGKILKDALSPPRMPGPLEGRLYRNDLVVRADGSRTLRFTDVTRQSGIHAVGYGMGVATGDYNNDGCVDLYITYLGDNQLWRNNCDGTFTDVTKASGTGDSGWSVSATFFDFDRDGWLDLFVGRYLDYSPEREKRPPSKSGARGYGGNPLLYDALPNRLFRNRGDGTFEDVSIKTRMASEYGGALGVVAADFNGDGRPDLFVANDERPNQLWIQQADGSFSDDALLAGCAVSWKGQRQAGMGVDAGDYDADGHEDLLKLNLDGEGNSLFRNDGHGFFDDVSLASGVLEPSLSHTGFGTLWFDFDNDGWLDFLTVNGAIRAIESLVEAHDPYPLHQTKQLFHNMGSGRFEEISKKAGPAFELSEVGRGAAFGDIDNDGDTDVVIANNNGPARLLINNVGNRKAWLGLRMVDARGKRDMLGTRVAVFVPGRPVLWRRVHTDGSYASANDPRVLVGLGDAASVTKVRAFWPDGRVEEWMNLPLRAYSTLREGSGHPVR